MSKIVSMSSGAIDPIAQSKRVFFRANTTTDSLKVGQPVCYDSDSVLDHKDRTSDPTHLGLRDDTYEQGAQEFTGRLFVVEEPLSANLHAFAGIVKCLGRLAGADGDMIEIWIPNGAVLPCWIDQSVTTDQTVLGIRDSVANITYPGTPIGIAKETKDRTTAGLCWVKVDPNMFLYQYPNTYLSISLSATDLHHSRVTTANISGFDHLDLRTQLSGALAGGNYKGILSYMHMSGAPTGATPSYVTPVHGQLNLEGTINAGGFIGIGGYFQVHGSSTLTEVNYIAGIWIDMSITNTAVAGLVECMRLTNSGACLMTNVFNFRVAKCTSFATFTNMDSGVTGCVKDVAGDHTIGSGDKALKCDVDGTTYYIPLIDSIA